MKCSNCGFENKPKSSFCIKCGTSLSSSKNSISHIGINVYSPQCHTLNKSQAKFCVTCGNPLNRMSSSMQISQISNNSFTSFGKSKKGQSILYGLLILSIGGGIFWFLSSSRSQSYEKETSFINQEISSQEIKVAISESKDLKEESERIQSKVQVNKPKTKAQPDPFFTRDPSISPDFLRASSSSALTSAKMTLESKNIFVSETSSAEKLIQDEQDTVEYQDLYHLLNEFLDQNGYRTYFSCASFSWGDSSLLDYSRYEKMLYQIDESLENGTFPIVVISSTLDGKLIEPTYGTIVDKQIVDGLSLYTLRVPYGDEVVENVVNSDNLRSMISIDGKAAYIYYPMTIK